MNKKFINLLPCPFCGNEPYQPEDWANKGRGKKHFKPNWVIHCTQHCIAMSRATKKEVVQDWNTRAPHVQKGKQE